MSSRLRCTSRGRWPPTRAAGRRAGVSRAPATYRTGTSARPINGVTNPVSARIGPAAAQAQPTMFFVEVAWAARRAFIVPAPRSFADRHVELARGPVAAQLGLARPGQIRLGLLDLRVQRVDRRLHRAQRLDLERVDGVDRLVDVRERGLELVDADGRRRGLLVDRDGL